MFKRLATTVALGLTLSLSVPSQVLSNEPKAYEDLTELHREVFKARDWVLADPAVAGGVA